MSTPLTRFEQLKAQHRADAASPDRTLWSRPYAWYTEQACNEVDALRARVAELEQVEARFNALTHDPAVEGSIPWWFHRCNELQVRLTEAEDKLADLEDTIYAQRI